MPAIVSVEFIFEEFLDDVDWLLIFVVASLDPRGALFVRDYSVSSDKLHFPHESKRAVTIIRLFLNLHLLIKYKR